jgi:hypothetical protein
MVVPQPLASEEEETSEGEGTRIARTPTILQVSVSDWLDVQNSHIRGATKALRVENGQADSINTG